MNQLNAMGFILAGAVVVGIGADLIQPKAIKQRERDWFANSPIGLFTWLRTLAGKAAA